VRIVIAEDNVLMSTGLELLLGSKGFDVAAVTRDAATFVAAVDDYRPDIAIVDVRLPPRFVTRASTPPFWSGGAIPACPC
jgi:DNA-binding response OmpR family regulator